MKRLIELYKDKMEAERKLRALYQGNYERSESEKEKVRPQIVDQQAVSRLYEVRRSELKKQVSALTGQEKALAMAAYRNPSQKPALDKLRANLAAVKAELAEAAEARRLRL